MTINMGKREEVMRKMLIIALSTTMLLITSCDSGGDGNSVNESAIQGLWLLSEQCQETTCELYPRPRHKFELSFASGVGQPASVASQRSQLLFLIINSCGFDPRMSPDEVPHLFLRVHFCAQAR